MVITQPILFYVVRSLPFEYQILEVRYSDEPSIQVSGIQMFTVHSNNQLQDSTITGKWPPWMTDGNGVKNGLNLCDVISQRPLTCIDLHLTFSVWRMSSVLAAKVIPHSSHFNLSVFFWRCDRDKMSLDQTSLASRISSSQSGLKLLRISSGNSPKLLHLTTWVRTSRSSSEQNPQKWHTNTKADELRKRRKKRFFL